MRQLVPRFAQPDVGCLTCLPRGIEAHAIGGKMIALHYGFNYLPQWMLAQQTTGIHWAIGHTMAVPRTALEKIGGFKNFLNHLADDYELGNRISKLGLRVIVPPLLLDCAMPARIVWPGVHPDAALETHHPPLARQTIFRRHSHLPGFLGVDFGLASAACLVVVERVAGSHFDSFLLAAGLQTVVKMPDWPRARWLLPVVDVRKASLSLAPILATRFSGPDRRYTLLRDGTLELIQLREN